MFDLILPVGFLAVTMAGSPGPNNLMLTASGAKFGFRKTVPHIIGVEAGMILLLGLSALGLGVVFTRVPFLRKILKTAGCAYIVYLAFRTALSKPGPSAGETGRPMTVYEAAAFQFLNPKAYVISITAMSVYPLAGRLYAASAVLILGIFAAVIPLMISLWAGFGTFIGTVLKSRGSGRLFQLLLGGLTLSSVLFLL